MATTIMDDQGSQELLDELSMGELEPEWVDLEGEEGETGQIKAEPVKKKAPRKSRKAASKKVDKERPLQTAPFQIHRFDDLQRSYLWLDEWKGDGASSSKKPPGPLQLRSTYGPGKYIVRDASSAEQRWRIGASPSDAPAEELETEPEAPEHYRPAPQPIVPQLPPHGYHAPAPQYHTPPPPRYAGPPHSSLATGAVAAPSPQLDPAVMSTIYRLDAAIQQISADQRRLQDELRSVTYELQQVPSRVAERVSGAITDAVDPFDQMAKVYEMSRNMADGLGPGEDKGPGMAEMVAAAVGALGGLAGGGAGAPGAAPPMPQPAQLPAPDSAPASTNGEDHSAEASELPGMTPELRTEIQAHAAARGITYQDAINLATRQGWDALTLVQAARATAASDAQATAQ